MERSQRLLELLNMEDSIPFDSDHYAMSSELMTKVMIQLSSLVLLRFKRVNTNWFRSIESTEFVEEHARFGEANRPGLLIQSDKIDAENNVVPSFHLFQSQEKKISNLPFPDIFNDVLSVQLLSAHNGMVLVRCKFDSNDKRLFLWNPITVECKQLLNLSDLGFQDAVASVAYSKKNKCYVALMFLSQKVDDQTICKLGFQEVKRNALIHFEDFNHIPFRNIEPHSVILNQKVYFLGLRKMSNGPTPNYVLEYDVDENTYRLFVIPSILVHSETKLVKDGDKIMLISWDQVENYPFMVHVSTLDVYNESFQLWKMIGLVGPLSPDETPIGMWNNNLMVVKERNTTHRWINNLPDRIFYKYSMDNRIRETLVYQRADFGILDVIEFSDSLLFTKEL